MLLRDERRGLETMTATRSLLARLPELALEALLEDVVPEQGERGEAAEREPGN